MLLRRDDDVSDFVLIEKEITIAIEILLWNDKCENERAVNVRSWSPSRVLIG